MRLSAKVAAWWIGDNPGGVVTIYQTGSAHLLPTGGPHAMCGSYLSPRVTSRHMTRSTGEFKDAEWCYSCIGNALEVLEKRAVSREQAG